MAYQYFRVREFLKLFVWVAIAIVVAAFLNFQFGLPLHALPIAGLVGLVGAVIWLVLVGKTRHSRRDLLNGVESNRAQERELIALLKTQAESDPEYRDHALRTIREIENSIETREAELKVITSLGQWHPPHAVLIRSKRILVVLGMGCLALFAVAHALGKPKAAAGLFSFGAFALWAAQHYFFTKQPIYRKGGPNIEFEKEPSAHTSAVLASCVLGIFFIFGAYALL